MLAGTQLPDPAQSRDPPRRRSTCPRWLQGDRCMIDPRSAWKTPVCRSERRQFVRPASKQTELRLIGLSPVNWFLSEPVCRKTLRSDHHQTGALIDFLSPAQIGPIRARRLHLEAADNAPDSQKQTSFVCLLAHSPLKALSLGAHFLPISWRPQECPAKFIIASSPRII